MKVALYSGNHAGDALSVRAGWWLTRKAQKGPYAMVTHVEAVHAEHPDGSVTIASASIRDEGVRAKRVILNPLHWWIADVPAWDTARSIALLDETRGEPYDWRGALATCLPGSPSSPHGFCNAWVGYPFLEASATFGPHQFAAIAFSLGRNATIDFFKSRDGTPV